MTPQGSAAVILAAGGSTRLGEPKQLVLLAGERLLDRTVRVAREAGCTEVVVVLGAGADAIQAACRLEGVQVVINPNWREGMGTSLAAGIAHLQGVGSAVILTCDQPAVTPEHLRELRNRVEETGRAVASLYAQRRGVPACVPSSSFGALCELTGDTGARELLKSAATITLPGGELDVDTLDSLAEARRIFG